MSNEKWGLFHDHFQNYKRYNIPKAQLVIADIPYNIGVNAYASNPVWYKDGNNKNGESELAGKVFFDTDKDFRIPEYMEFCNRMMKPETKERNSAAAMLVFCSFEQQFMLIEEARKHKLKNYINLVFRKNFSAQVLKANMRVVGNCEYGLLFYREKLPKFNNKGRMIFNCIDFPRDLGAERIHPTQKPIALLEMLIDLFTDPGDVVIDPCAGSGSTLIAALNLNRRAFGFEIKKEFYKNALRLINENVHRDMFSEIEIKETENRKRELLEAKNE